MKDIDDGFELSSGRRIRARMGVLGLNADLNDLYEGYEGYANEALPPDNTDIEPADAWTVLTEEERREIADYMIALWERFAKEGAKGMWGEEEQGLTEDHEAR